MNTIGPITTRFGASGITVVERRLELPGLIFELAVNERLSPQIVFGPHESHLVTLALSPMPKTWQCQFLPKGRPRRVGTLNLLPANVRYRLTPRGDRHRWLITHIDPQYLRTFVDVPQNYELQPALNIQGTSIEATLFRIAREMEAPGLATKALVRALGESVVIELARYALGPSPTPPSSREGLTSARLTRITEFVENAENTCPTIPEISEMLGLSPRHLTRIFKTTVGQTIHAFVAEIRLRKAIGLLTTTELSIKEISRKLGYSSPWGLSVGFREATGQTPTQFRRQHRDIAR
jgi:AraC family transcriptional regulator